MYDIGQIEVLRGPQGTLRGRSTPSGSITVSTRKPDLNEFGGYASLTSNDIGGQNINGALNFPIVAGKLAVRIAGLNDDTEGNRVRSVVNPNVEQYVKTRSGRVTINFQPNDSFSALLGFTRLNTRSLRYDQVESVTAGPGSISAKDRLAVEDNPGTVDQAFDVYTLQTEWKVGGQRVNLSAAQQNQHFQSRGVGDSGNFFDSSFPQTFQSYGQFTNTHAYADTFELRVANQDPLFGHFDYVAGAFSEHLSSPTDLSPAVPGPKLQASMAAPFSST
jgi:iron complex outermembrane receptor protein